MAKVNIYLNFTNKTEEAFNFYKKVFGTEFAGQGMMKFSSSPPMDGMPSLSEAEKNLVMHVELPIIGGQSIMGSDAPPSHGFNIAQGNNFSINLSPDSRAEVDKLYNALAEGGQRTFEPSQQFWGSYFGTLTDKFGIQWMFNTDAK
jgi:PhnB protein